MFRNHRDETKIIHSSTFNDFIFDLDFKFWHYVKMKINIDSSHSNILISICFDFDCDILIIDRTCLIFQRSNYVCHVLLKSKSLKIKNINSSMLIIDEYFSINFIIFEKINDTSITICFIRFFYIVNNLKINILFDNDILKSKNIVIHVDKKKFIIIHK